MKFSIVENVPTPRESIFKLCTASQRPYTAKSKKYRKKLRKFDFLCNFPYFPGLELFPISKICGPDWLSHNILTHLVKIIVQLLNGDCARGPKHVISNTDVSSRIIGCSRK